MVGRSQVEDTSFRKINDGRYYHMCSSSEHTLLIEKDNNRIQGFGDNRFNQVNNSTNRLTDLSLVWNKLPPATAQMAVTPIVASGVYSFSIAGPVGLRVQRKCLCMGQSHEGKAGNRHGEERHRGCSGRPVWQYNRSESGLRRYSQHHQGQKHKYYAIPRDDHVEALKISDGKELLPIDSLQKIIKNQSEDSKMTKMTLVDQELSDSFKRMLPKYFKEWLRLTAERDKVQFYTQAFLEDLFVKTKSQYGRPHVESMRGYTLRWSQ